MNKESELIDEESDEKIVEENEEEKLKELKRKRNCERQRAYYQRQKDLKKNEKKIKKERKKKETVPKSNAERQRKFRQRHAEKSKRQKLDSHEENVVQCRAVENKENVRWKRDLKMSSSKHESILKTILQEESEDGNEEDAAPAHASNPKRIEQNQTEASHSFIPEESGTEDKYEILGRYVALKVRQLDNKQRLFVERIINEALYEGQMGTLNMNSQLVVNTETFVYGRTSDGGRTGIEVPEIKVEKEDCTRVKVEMDLEDPEDVPSEYEDVMDDKSNSLEGAALDSISDHCSGAKRRRLEESDETILSHLVNASNIKAEVITEDNNHLLENCGTHLNTTRIFESICSNNATRKRLLETEDEKSFSEPHLGVVKVEVDIEENWNPLDALSEH